MHLIVLVEVVLADLVVVESGEGRLDAVSLSHLEVLPEVLVSAPPVSVDEAGLLVLPDLVEVRVSHVVLLSIGGESPVGVLGIVESAHLSDAPSPSVHHRLLLGLHGKGQEEGLVQVEDQGGIEEPESILGSDLSGLPEEVGEWVLDHSGEVLVDSPFLGHISGLLGLGNELAEVTIGLLGECSIIKL